MCYECVLKGVLQGVVYSLCGVVMGKTIYDCFNRNKDTTDEYVQQVQQVQRKNPDKVKIAGKLVDVSQINEFAIGYTCDSCLKTGPEYVVSVYNDNCSGTMLNRISHNQGDKITVISVCEKCRNEIFKLSETNRRANSGRRIIATYYHDDGTDSGICVRYTKIIPELNKLCPYIAVERCAYSSVCMHCNLHGSKFSVILEHSGKCVQCIICKYCHQELLDKQESAFPLDASGNRIYHDIDVITYAKTIPVGAKISKVKTKSMYPDLNKQ